TPGTLLGWATAVERFGRLPLATIMSPAVRFARNGFRVSPYLHSIIDMTRDELARFPASAAVFLPDGQPPRIDTILRRSDYAETLERIGQEGPDWLYRGP